MPNGGFRGRIKTGLGLVKQTKNWEGEQKGQIKLKDEKQNNLTICQSHHIRQCGQTKVKTLPNLSFLIFKKIWYINQRVVTSKSCFYEMST